MGNDELVQEIRCAVIHYGHEASDEEILARLQTIKPGVANGDMYAALKSMCNQGILESQTFSAEGLRGGKTMYRIKHNIPGKSELPTLGAIPESAR